MQVEDILSADKQLGNEILYDIRRSEEEAKAAARSPATVAQGAQDSAIARAASAAPNTPGLRDPTPLNSPLLSPSIFQSGRKSGSPAAFTVPRLRGQVQTGGARPKSRLSVVRGAPASDGGSVSSPLAWVRPPLAKQNAAAAAESSSGAAAIKLATPGSEPSATKWAIRMPHSAADQPQAMKRVRHRASEGQENDATPSPSRKMPSRRTRGNPRAKSS